MTSRINPILIAVIGVVLCLAAVGGITYFLILPERTKSDAATQRYNAAYPDSTPQAQKAAHLDLVKAQGQVQQAQLQWRVIENTIMPRYDVSHRYLAWQQLSHELAINLGPSIQRWIPLTHVVPLTDITIAPPPASPNAITAAPLIVPIGSGTLQVGGSFRNILYHVQQWNNFNRLVQIDGLALHGNSPYMQGEYTAKVIIFPQNDTVLGKPITAAGSGTAVGGVGTAVGGPSSYVPSRSSASGPR